MSTPLRLVHSTGHDDETPNVLERWEIYMRARGLRERTITERLQCLARLQTHAAYPIAACTLLQIERFLGQRHFGNSTKNTYYGHLWLFYSWLSATDNVPNPMAKPGARAPRRHTSEPRPINEKQLKALLGLRLRHKTRVMVLLAALAGLRAFEIAKIKGEDIDLVDRTIFVEGKGGNRRTIPLHSLLVEIAETMPRRGYWFPSPYKHRAGQPVRREFVGDVVGDAMRRVGITWGGPHRLRHTFATMLAERDVDLLTLQKLMRHESVQSTQIYAAVSDRRRREAIERLTLD